MSKNPINKKSNKRTASQLNKFEKQNILEQQRRIKPGECHKYIKVLIHPEFVNGIPKPKIISALANINIDCEIQNQKVPRTILWERLEQQFLVSETEKNNLSDKNRLEKHILLLLYPEDLMEAIDTEIPIKLIEDIILHYQDFTLTLIIFGLKNFCKSNPTAINKIKLEQYLTELQIMHNCSHRVHETADEVAETVAQFSKSIAEIPFKKQQTEKFENICIFLENDNKDCVRVEGCAGLPRLWQQHLTRLPYVTLETTESIIHKYPSPKSLLDAFEKEVNAPLILEDLKTRRAGLHLTSARRIGPELSRKIHTLYTSLDENEIL